jgi:hypothetical protein
MESQRASHAAEHIRALKADPRVQRRREILQHEVGSHLFNCLAEPAPPRRGDTSKMAAALAAHLRAGVPGGDFDMSVT